MACFGLRPMRERFRPVEGGDEPFDVTPLSGELGCLVTNGMFFGVTEPRELAQGLLPHGVGSASARYGRLALPARCKRIAKTPQRRLFARFTGGRLASLLERAIKLEDACPTIHGALLDTGRPHL